MGLWQRGMAVQIVARQTDVLYHLHTYTRECLLHTLAAAVLECMLAFIFLLHWLSFCMSSFLEKILLCK